MLTKKAFQKLIMSHGPVVYFSRIEGDVWVKHKSPESQYKPGLNSMQAMHALCFLDGTQWDEINGIRPKECTWPPDAPQKDLRHK